MSKMIKVKLFLGPNHISDKWDYLNVGNVAWVLRSEHGDNVYNVQMVDRHLEMAVNADLSPEFREWLGLNGDLDGAHS